MNEAVSGQAYKDLPLFNVSKYTPLTPQASRTAMRERVDMPVIYQALTAKIANMQQCFSDILQSDYFDKYADDPEALAMRVILEDFGRIYVRDGGVPREDAVENLANTLVERTEVVTLEELLLTAKFIAMSSESKDIVLYLSTNDHDETPDGDTHEIGSSNSFMAYICSLYAASMGKQVHIVTDIGELEGFDDVIHYVDDAMFRGSQALSRIVFLMRNLQGSARIQLTVARSTEYALGRLRKAAADASDRIDFEAVTMRQIRTTSEVLADAPDALHFSYADGMTRAASHDEPPSVVMEQARLKVSRDSLTILATKTPDYYSYPDYLELGMPLNGVMRAYPRLDRSELIW